MRVKNNKKLIGLSVFIVLCSTLVIGSILYSNSNLYPKNTNHKSVKKSADSVSEINNINARDNVVKADVFEEFISENHDQQTTEKELQVINKEQKKDSKKQDANASDDKKNESINQQVVPNEEEQSKSDHEESNQVKPPLIEEPGWTLGIY